MRRSEDRCSPEPVKVVPRVEQSEENVDHQPVDKGQDLTGAAEEAYRRFEQTFSETSSSKSSPKSPQFLSLLPPPPPPPKPIQQQSNVSKKGAALSADMVHLLVPPPPPPPPQPPMKDVPPPPPPRRPKASILEDLPPPPPPPKRLKPSRSSAVNVPVPFSQRLERIAASEPNDGASNCADASAENSSVEKSSSSSEEPQKDVPNEDDEVAAGIKPKRKEEVIVEERIPESTEKFEIDFYNGDLHLKGAPDNDWIIDPDNQDGLALVWGGVRSTHGILPKCR
ncbi:hypothetical protein TELCIR_10498 [Teladorsagia circumcincta]|uniref:Uncharacterized protein n=1 Tax=Teladorsagia circumcincta TaxID=45464 RepID=A0A2G9UBZ1_TELCI|nr:hypothetical protein TELCIR_10498 [Teladorsagia circumcincta]